MGTKNLLKTIFKAIDEDTSLSAKEKRRAKRTLRWRPYVRRQVFDAVILEAAFGGHDAEAEIDWEELLEFIKALIPVIMELIALFT